MKLSSIVFLLLIVVSTIGITFPVSAEVVINEILYHAADSELEFIELYNPGGESIDLSRWSVKDDIDSHRFAFPSGTVISSEGYLVITNDAVQFRTAYSFDADLSGLPFNLSNAGDTVRLFDSSGTLVEWIRYDDRAPWPESADGSGISLERRHPLLPANESSAWAASTPNGTPGEQNSAYTEELEPLILDLDHNPKIPSPSEEVTVTARVLDADGNVDSVQLSYGYGDGLSYETIAMMDDGLHGDGEAGDGVYGASIPGSNNLTVIRFYIRAVDDEGLDASLPMEGPREPYLTVVESQGRAERVSFLRIVMTPENQAAFLQKYQTDEYTPATFYDGETVYYRVNIRHRGRSRSVNARFKILFPHHQLYRDKIRRLNLNGTDYSTLLKQYISYQLYGAAGLPNLETEIVRFHINGSAAQGIPYRCAIENPDRQFLRRKNFFSDDSGNLYKTTLDGTPENKATWRYIGDDPSLYERSYLKQTNEEEADWSDVVQFCKALSEPETWDDDYLEQVYSVLNTDEFLLWMAVSACVAHWDSPFTDHGQNYVLYNNPQTRQFHILAWDLNGTFNYTSNLDDLNYRKLYTHLRSTKFPAINKILNHPVFGAQYYRNVDGLLGTLFSKSSMDARIEEARSALQLSSYQTSFMQTYLIRRREDLAEWINREQGAAFLTKPVYQAIVGDPYMYHATAVDYRRASRVTYDLKQAPSWLTLDSNRGILQGIPPETGRFEIELAAQTGQGIELTQSFELHVVSPEPRLLMNMNETSGPALDVSVYGHEGQLAGDAQRVDGRLGQAVYLDGSRDYIRIPHSEDLNLTGEITVEAWIRPDSISNGNPVILTKGDADHFNYTLMLGYGPFSWDAMEPCFMPARFGIEHRVYYGRKEIEAQLRPRSWSHIAGTYNSTSELVCVYYNNYRIVESACRALMTENTNALLIGLNSSQCFRGAVDDVKILPFEENGVRGGIVSQPCGCVRNFRRAGTCSDFVV